MSTIEIRTHPAHLGMSSDEPIIDTAMRLIAVAFGDEDEWPEKYGTNVENDVFMMYRYCWCDKEDGSCLWCMHGDHPEYESLLRARFGTIDLSGAHYYDPPHFWYKPTDFRLIWYKYIGRDMAANKDSLPSNFLERIFATHPKGLSINDARQLLAKRTEETQDAFRSMIAEFSFASKEEER